MKQANYYKFPATAVQGFDGQAFAGYESIGQELNRKLAEMGKAVKIVTVECYPAVREDEVRSAFDKALRPALVLHADDVSDSGECITEKLKPWMTDDRVFGVMHHGTLEQFFAPEALAQARAKIAAVTSGVVLVYGVGASIITQCDVLVYADLARWEIQQRYRSKEFGNWKTDNHGEDILRKYKRGFFAEWRMADRLKKELFGKLDYLLDTNEKNAPKMITAEAFFQGLQQTVRRPFRLVPYFDPGVWGGQWMKEVCGLDKSKENFAWSFDGVPEENSLYLLYGDVRVEIPSIDLVFTQPAELLGDRVHARFGTEFPIRFDFLDTVGGQNLSLQVHPLTEYIQDKFGMHYTQDESYYILDAKEGAEVFLGVKEGIQPEEMIQALERANRGEESFPAQAFVNRFPAKKHDHFLIPAGTVHCSGSGCMVLEISATPYIFTFKLWDWDRLGLDGLPRPVHLAHGARNIQYDRNTAWVKENLVDRVEPLEEGEGWRSERTGLHEREFIETRRYWAKIPVLVKADGSVHMCNLVEGHSAFVRSPSNLFEPFEVHYAETFIVPACAGDFLLCPAQESGQEIGVICASVRG